MQWRRGGQYYIVSDAGYTVCRYHVGDRVVYTAWTPRAKVILDADDLEAAKAACVDHMREVA